MNCKVRVASVFVADIPGMKPEGCFWEIPHGSRISDLITLLGLPANVICTVNGSLQRDRNYILNEDDEVYLFRTAAGG